MRYMMAQARLCFQVNLPLVNIQLKPLVIWRKSQNSQRKISIIKNSSKKQTLKSETKQTLSHMRHVTWRLISMQKPLLFLLFQAPLLEWLPDSAAQLISSVLPPVKKSGTNLHYPGASLLLSLVDLNTPLLCSITLST